MLQGFSLFSRIFLNYLKILSLVLKDFKSFSRILLKTKDRLPITGNRSKLTNSIMPSLGLTLSMCKFQCS